MLQWDDLERECRACQKCVLSETRTNVVFGVGNRNSDVLFVGEGPGEQEDKLGEPFVGRAGKLLDDMLAVIGLDRSKIYIANIVKCRPPGNRDPLNIEQDSCIGYLRNQFALIKPKIIVCLGRVAAARLIKEDFKITQEHGLWFDKGTYKFMGMYHPAYLLRDPRKKPDTFEDLLKLEVMMKDICVKTSVE